MVLLLLVSSLVSAETINLTTVDGVEVSVKFNEVQNALKHSLNLPPEAKVNGDGTVTLEHPKVRQGSEEFLIQANDRRNHNNNHVCEYFNLGKALNARSRNVNGINLACIMKQNNQVFVHQTWVNSYGWVLETLTCDIKP